MHTLVFKIGLTICLPVKGAGSASGTYTRCFGIWLTSFNPFDVGVLCGCSERECCSFRKKKKNAGSNCVCGSLHLSYNISIVFLTLHLCVLVMFILFICGIYMKNVPSMLMKLFLFCLQNYYHKNSTQGEKMMDGEREDDGRKLGLKDD